MVASAFLIACVLLSFASSTLSFHATHDVYESQKAKYLQITPLERQLKLKRTIRTYRSLRVVQEPFMETILSLLDQNLVVPLPLLDSCNYLAEKLIEKDLNIDILTTLLEIRVTNSSLLNETFESSRNLQELKKLDLNLVKMKFIENQEISIDNDGISVSAVIAHNARVLGYSFFNLESYLDSLNEERSYFINRERILNQYQNEDLKRWNMKHESYKFALDSMKEMLCEALKVPHKFSEFLAKKYNDLTMLHLLTAGKLLVVSNLKNGMNRKQVEKELNKLNKNLNQLLSFEKVDFNKRHSLVLNFCPSVLSENGIRITELLLYNSYVRHLIVKNEESQTASSALKNPKERKLAFNQIYDHYFAQQRRNVVDVISLMTDHEEPLPLPLILDINRVAKQLRLIKLLKDDNWKMTAMMKKSILFLAKHDYEYEKLKRFDYNRIFRLKSKDYDPTKTEELKENDYMYLGVPCADMEEYHAFLQAQSLPLYEMPPSYEDVEASSVSSLLLQEAPPHYDDLYFR